MGNKTLIKRKIRSAVACPRGEETNTVSVTYFCREGKFKGTVAAYSFTMLR